MRKGGTLLSMTSRLVFICSLYFSIYVFAMFQGGKVSWTIFYVMTPFLLYSMALFLYPMNDVKATRIIQSKAIERGGKLSVTVKIQRTIPFPLLYTVVTEKWMEPLLEVNFKNEHKHIFIFGFKRMAEFSYEIEKLPRGEHIVSGIDIEVSDFFGWIKKNRFIESRDRILVYPNTTPMQYVPLDSQYDRGSLVSPFSLIKDTTMATGVRDYQSGDRVTWIHWKSFARTQNLMTKEFEDRQSEDLIILLDGRESATFEGQVELAASILEEASAHQSTVSFVSVGEETEVFPYIHSTDQMHAVFVHLAKINSTPINIARQLDSSAVGSLSGSMIVVTGNPDWSFIQSVSTCVPSVKSIICFVVVEQEKKTSTELLEQLKLVKSKGIKVHVLNRLQFSDAFREVSTV